MLEIKVFQFEQPGGTFYCGRVKSRDLVGKLVVRRRSAQEDGVQRDLAVKRVAEVADYLSTADAIMPTPLVISVESAEVKSEDGGLTLLVEAASDGCWGEIIDGQHRYAGLKSARGFDDSDVPVCIFVDLKVEDKATLFSTINSTQVRVPKSYIYDLFDYTDANTPVKFCHDVCKVLNYDERGPLYRRVKMLGKKLGDSEVLSQAAVVDALMPLISRNSKADDHKARTHQELEEVDTLPLRSLYLAANTIVFSKAFSNFLSALREVSQNNWENYVLKSVGIRVFSQIFGMLAAAGINRGTLSREFFLSCLQPAQAQIQECTVNAGTNSRAERDAVSRLSQFVHVADID